MEDQDVSQDERRKRAERTLALSRELLARSRATLGDVNRRLASGPETASPPPDLPLDEVTYFAAL